MSELRKKIFDSLLFCESYDVNAERLESLFQSELEKQRDEFAVGFAISVSTHCYCELGSRVDEYNKLLEDYKINLHK